MIWSNRRSVLLLLVLLAACQSAPPPAPKPEAADPAIELNSQALESARMGDAEAAAQQFRRLLELKPDAPHAWTNLGLQLLKLDQPEQAKAAFLKAIEQDKSDAVAYTHLGVLSRRAGEFAQALSWYDQAIAAQPDYAAAHLNRGILLDLYLQDLPQALSEYEQYLSLAGDDADPKVEKWIIDIKRRIETRDKKK